LVDWKLLKVEDPSGLLKNPIVAIYTPFSFTTPSKIEYAVSQVWFSTVTGGLLEG